MARSCEDCSCKMPPYVPRVNVGGRMLCAACAERPRGGMVSASLRTASNSRIVHVRLPEDPHEAHALLTSLANQRTAAQVNPPETGAYDEARTRDVANNGGFSAHPWREGTPAHGFMASYSDPENKGYAQEHDMKDLTPDHIAQHRAAMRDKFMEPGTYQGGWLDRKTSKVYLDASRHFNREPAVRQHCQDHNQIAYYDLHNGDSIYMRPDEDPLKNEDPAAHAKKYQRFNQPERTDHTLMANLQVHAHDSGDGQTIYHCFAGETSYITRDGVKTFAETVGTTQFVLANVFGNGGAWIEAPIMEFGEQRLWAVTVRRNKQTKVIYATDEHRWLLRRREGAVLTKDLKAEDRLAWVLPRSAIGASTPSQFGIAHGVVYGDGTRAAKGSTLNLWGEKDAQLLRYFSESRTSPVKTEAGVLGLHIMDLPSFFKERPSLDESIPYLYGWVAGYFAADGSVSTQGQASLSSASRQDLEFVQTVCLRLGVATYPIAERQRKGYGDEDSALYSMQFVNSTLRSQFFLVKEHRERYQAAVDRGNPERLGWTVVSVEETDRIEPVYCAVVHGPEAFALEDYLYTGNCPFCGSGQVIARSDRTIECEFCHTCFTVQVQPEFSAFPQSIDGMPVTVPGMPGMQGVDPSGASDGITGPVSPDELDETGAMGPGGQPGDPSAADAENESEDDSDGGNPFTGSLSPFDQAARAFIQSVPPNQRKQAAKIVRERREAL